jgi:hypothetical protein
VEGQSLPCQYRYFVNYGILKINSVIFVPARFPVQRVNWTMGSSEAHAGINS